ncbi:MAG TPA: hypothetical protein VIP11_07710 [Gemmatimonadaceae bacterium]
MLSDARMKQRVDEGSLVLPQRVTWLTFPVSRAAFAAMLDTLLPSPADVVRRVTAGCVEAYFGQLDDDVATRGGVISEGGPPLVRIL